MVTWAHTAPACMPARALATARPKSLWQWTETGRPDARTASETMLAMYEGVEYPTVSGMSMRSAPASATREKTSPRYDRSVRVASSAENSTVSPRDFAYSTAETARSAASALLIFSLCSRCMSDVAMNVWTYVEPASATASMSLRLARASPHMSQERPADTIMRIPSASPADITGNPASMASTPSRSSRSAMASFCAGERDIPGVCSPSRSVVSNMRTLMPRSSAAPPCRSGPSPVCRTSRPAPRTPGSGLGWRSARPLWSPCGCRAPWPRTRL